MMKSRICLIRHGITEGNKRRLYYGHSDIPLSEEGEEELANLTTCGIYPDSEKASFYTTGLLRTEQTLNIIYGDRPHEVIEELKEINFGTFEMKSYEDLKERDDYQTWIGGDMTKVGPPKGESTGEFAERIGRGFDELMKRHQLKVLSMRHKAEDALSVVVCHGGSISVIMEILYPGVKENFYQWIPDPGHGYILELENGAVVNAEKF